MASKPLVVGCKNASLAGQVTFRNLTKGEKVTVTAVDGEAVASKEGWENGDVIMIEVTGKYNTSSAVTASNGSALYVTGTLTEDTTTPGVNL